MKKTKTSRGFVLYEFQDNDGIKCSLQQSSLATKECVWLGSDEDQKIHPVRGELLTMRMHLNRKLAKEIGLKLIAFSEAGFEGI